MRLQKLQLKNFQAVDSLTLEGFEQFATIIGPPHSGKTSILESLFFQFNHEGMQDAQKYFSFLNRTLDAEKFYSIETSIEHHGDSYRCVTTVSLEGESPSYTNGVWKGNQKLPDDEAKEFFVLVRDALKFHASSETDKGMYFPGPEETTEQRKERLFAELKSLQGSPRYTAFMAGLREAFPNLPKNTQPEQLLEFFGVGFYHTLKLFVYLYHPSFAIVLIDEPEIYFYPGLTHRFLTLVHDELQEQKDKQVLIASHSPVLLQETDTMHFYVTRRKSGQTHVERVTTLQLTARLDVLGVPPADAIRSEMIVYVEGPSDIGVFEEFIKKFPELQETGISIFQLGGDSMGHTEVEPAKLKQHNPLSFAIIDSERKHQDGQADPAHQRFIDRCYDAHLYCTMLERAAIENYFTERALRAYYEPKRYRIRRNFRMHPYKTLKRQGIGMYEKSHARGIAKLMTRDEIEAYPDLHAFFQELIRTAKRLG